MVLKGMPATKVRVVPLVYRKQLVTDGLGANRWKYLDLDVEEVLNWGPHLYSMVPHTNLVQSSTNFHWKVVFYWSSDGKVWSSPVDLFADFTTSGDVVQTPFTDTSKFGLNIRFALAYTGVAGTVVESGVVSCAVAFNFLT